MFSASREGETEGKSLRETDLSFPRPRTTISRGVQRAYTAIIIWR